MRISTSQPNHAPTGSGARRSGRLPGVLVLCALALVAAWVLITQQSFNPAVTSYLAAMQAQAPASSAQTPDLAAFAPASLKPLSPAETFGPGDLYVKINGKADLYLTSGFEKLTAQRFGLADDPNLWLELFKYDMASPRRAYAVFSQQRRPGAQGLDMGDFAYQAKNSLYLSQGPHYLELMGSADDPRLQEAMRALVQNLAVTLPGGRDAIEELAWFSAQGLVAGSHSLAVGNAFGWNGFGELFLARYQINGQDMTAFLQACSTEKEAAALAQAYGAFLEQNGAQFLPSLPDMPGARLWDFIGAYELVFSHGRVFGGVHESYDREAAITLGRAMWERLGKAAP